MDAIRFLLELLLSFFSGALVLLVDQGVFQGKEVQPTAFTTVSAVMVLQNLGDLAQ